MSVNVKPLADRVLIEPVQAEQKTASGIIIPDTAKEKPQKGTVVAVGPGKTDEPVTVKVGDTVLYGKYAGTELSVEGKDYLIMRERPRSSPMDVVPPCICPRLQIWIAPWRRSPAVPTVEWCEYANTVDGSLEKGGSRHRDVSGRGFVALANSRKIVAW